MAAIRPIACAANSPMATSSGSSSPSRSPIDPKLLLMDEPAAGMAPSERRALMALTARIAREQSIGVLFTEHDMDVVFGHADRLLVLNRGELIAEGPPAEVRAREDVRAVYLGAGALSEARIERAGETRPSPGCTPPTAGRACCSTSPSTSAPGEAVALHRPQRRGQVDDVSRHPRARDASRRRDPLRRRGHIRSCRRMRSCAAGSAMSPRTGASSPI